MATFPAILPLPNKDGYGINPKSGVIKTPMSSGLARQRRITSNPPTEIPVKWKFTHSEFGIFEAWFLHEAKMGAEWFDIELVGGLGLIPHKARFTDEGYKAVLDSESNTFEVTCTLEAQSRPTLTEGALGLMINYGYEDLVQTEELLTTTTDNFFNGI